jgi:hypothetical protein
VQNTHRQGANVVSGALGWSVVLLIYTHQFDSLLFVTEHLGGLVADQVLVGGVHIHCCGNGRWRFRPYGDSLFFKRQKK